MAFVSLRQVLDHAAANSYGVVAQTIASIKLGISRRAPMELSLWKWPPKPFWYASPWMRTTIGFVNWPSEKYAREQASPRN